MSDLESKAKRLADSNASLQPSPSSGVLLPLVDSAGAAPVGLRYSLRLSFAEIYEESITDLLAQTVQAPGSGSTAAEHTTSSTLTLALHPVVGVTIPVLTLSPHVATISAFNQLVETGRRVRCTSESVFGNAAEFSSAVLRNLIVAEVLTLLDQITVSQTLRLQNGSQQELVSTLDLVELPATDRLARTSESVRLAEHPLLNKSLFAVSDVVDQLVKCSDTSQQQQPLAMLSAVPYAASTLTLLLQEVLGGNCLTLALLSVVPGDFAGSKTTLQLGRALADVRNFPLVNSAMVQGQRWRHIARLTAIRDDKPLANSDDLMRERKVLKLERDLVHAAFENRTLTEDRDKLAGFVAELKEKYRLLFDNELELRKELLASEQDKLALSKAFVQFQLDKAEQVQALDSAKFELETKLAQAEQLVLDIQQGDNTKAEQLQGLCVKLSEVVRDKTKLAEDLELLQLHARDQMQALDKESKKNQQLSLELIVAVNQKLKVQSERENIEAANRDIIARAQGFERDLERTRGEARETEIKLAKSVSQIEEMRMDLARKELELERLALSAKQEQLQRDKADSEATRDRSARSDQLAGQLDVERAAFAGEKRMLSLQLERALVEGKQLAKEKEELITAWMAKSRDTEELAAQNDRLRAEMQAQVEVFRAKLTRVQDATASSQTTAPGTGPSVSALALSELMLSYQSREKQLRDQLERSEADRIALLQRRYDQQPEGIRQQEAVAVGRQAGPQAQRESKAFEEARSFREQRAIAEQQLALEREQRSAQTLAAISLERHNQELARECQAWEAKYRELEHAMQNTARQSREHRPPDADAAAITQMHATLLQQIDEIRRLTLATQQQQQQQQQQDKSNQATHEPSLPAAASNRDQVAVLRSENKQLAAKLAASKDQWGKVVEEVERRCAALLTKNVMLAEENQHLQQHVKVRSPNNSLLDWWLRLCVS